MIAIDRAGVLIEALPYIREYHDQIIVIKYGGNAMIDENLKKAVIQDVLLLHLVGIHVVLVHGGGPDISQMLNRVKIPSRFENGLRITNKETMDIVQMVLCGKVNKDLVALFDGLGVGLSGMDGGLFRALPHKDETKIEYGYVGEIVSVDPKIVLDVIEKGYIPVVSSVATGMHENSTYNINADTAASKLASALHAKKLILLTDVPGLMKDPNDPDTLIRRLKVSQVPPLVMSGIISGGMIPKVECCVEAVRQGVEKASILDGRIPHSVLIELLSDTGIGTMFS
ncbi:acetylglutamate kinase [Firmicutes bacterium M10-2]|nr:acetylglutamate kinase [Firmicutes bacterium M10-2]